MGLSVNTLQEEKSVERVANQLALAIVIPFLNDNISLTKNAFVVAQFIAPLIFTFVRSSNSH